MNNAGEQTPRRGIASDHARDSPGNIATTRNAAAENSVPNAITTEGPNMSITKPKGKTATYKQPIAIENNRFSRSSNVMLALQPQTQTVSHQLGTARRHEGSLTKKRKHLLFNESLLQRGEAKDRARSNQYSKSRTQRTNLQSQHHL
jgi:hypothetical protein